MSGPGSNCLCVGPTLRVTDSRAFRDCLHKTFLSMEGTAGPKEGQGLPRGRLASWPQNSGLLWHTPFLKSRGSSIQQTFAQCIPSSWDRGRKEEQGTESGSGTKSLWGLGKSLPSSRPQFYHLLRVNFWASWVVVKVKETDNHWARTQSGTSSAPEAYAKLCVWVA